MKWYDCRVFRVAFSTGAVVAAVPAPTSRIRSALHKAAICAV
ncbi:HMWP1 nonribosomal peptide/polyketide synthase [Yersinia pestis PY-36]|nr:hypothetical protein YPPY01_2172 [Yersinia pestis PY-01]EIR89147.1 HMWP1 nonribosomal peptide/polyketide synthase [Yersinia pestis PY-36]EIS06769.1 HMWP1 nonribosomal peptide/polyketide synthase [Yersinia pestis PY-48]